MCSALFRFTAFCHPLAVCDNNEDTTSCGGIIRDKTVMAKRMADIKALGKGKSVMIFQEVPLTSGSAFIDIQDPDAPAKVMHHTCI